MVIELENEAGLTCQLGPEGAPVVLWCEVGVSLSVPIADKWRALHCTLHPPTLYTTPPYTLHYTPYTLHYTPLVHSRHSTLTQSTLIFGATCRQRGHLRTPLVEGEWRNNRYCFGQVLELDPDNVAAWKGLGAAGGGLFGMGVLVTGLTGGTV